MKMESQTTNGTSDHVNHQKNVREQKQLGRSTTTVPTVLPIIIFHPGSKHLRIGKSTDPSPTSVLHAIGRRRRVRPGINTLRRDGLLPNDDCGATNSQKPPPEVESARLQLCYTLQTALRSDGSSRFATPTQTISGYNQLCQGDCQEMQAYQLWEEFPGREIIYGDEIFRVNPDSSFNIHFPMRRGQLNVHENISGSLSSVITDLCDLWSSCITNNLRIPLHELKNYRAVIILPVMFDKNHAKEILNMILNMMGFVSAFIIQDHICASFGSGLSTALVVDVGDQKISVSCVEDGISIPQTRILLKYGGIDLTSALLHLMKQSAVPLPVDRRHIWDIEFVNKLKENLCHLNLDRCGPEEHLLKWDKPGSPQIGYKIHFGDELLIVPLSYFNPDLLRGSLGAKPVGLYRPQYQSYIADDPFGDTFINETSRKVKESSDDGDDDDMDNNKEETAQPASKSDSHNLLGIVQAIIQSIDSSDCNEETKRRLYSSILLVGGGFKFHGFDSWLQNKLSITIPKQFRADIEVITQGKERDPCIATWKGATVLVQLETASELWISKDEWNKHGSRILREKCLCSF